MHRVLTVFVVFTATLIVAPSRPVLAQAGSAHAVSVPAKATRVLPGSRPNLSTIQGNALDSTNTHLPNTMVRLRDARFGHIVDQQITDKSGFFAFNVVDPGSYVVEIVAPDKTILAASQILNVNAGDAVSAVVRLPFKIRPFAGLLGHTLQSAAAVTAAAASSEVLAAVVRTDASAEKIRK